MTAPDAQVALELEPVRPTAETDPREIAVRHSCLKQMARSAAHYRHALFNSGDDTLARRLGSGTHAMLLDQPFIVYPGKRVRGKPNKDGAVKPSKWDEFALEHADKVILSPKEHAHAAGMAAAILRHNRARELLLDGTTIEHRIDWTFREGAVERRCRSTPDAFGRHHVVELKTARDASEERFVRDGQRMAYHAQLAFYGDAILDAGVGTASEYFIVAVESKPPYPITIFRLTDRAIGFGRRANAAWMQRLAACERDNTWPEYATGEVGFDVSQDEFEWMFGDELEVADDRVIEETAEW